MVGQTISHYRVVELLGGGGMGVVYKAIDLRLNRPVALKFLASELTQDAVANQRLRQEAQAASALDHPNICTIYEIDETPDRRLFIALAFYEGETLKKKIERGLLPISTALDIACQIAQGLGCAHQAGLVHRDIKPANVMIGADRLLKIVDFGLAKLTGDAEMTRTGTTLGTVAYMSPEQARGGAVDAATDIWATGVVLYEMLAGMRPFAGKDEVAVLASILNDRPAPVSAVRPDVPNELERILAKMLEKDRKNRYGSTQSLLADLTACRARLGDALPQHRTLSQFIRRPVVASAAAAFVLLTATAATIFYREMSRTQWARNEAIPRILDLIRSDDYMGAFNLARQVDAIVPSDPILATLWPQFSAEISLTTDPEHADVYVQPYGQGDDRWDHLGQTPLSGVRLARGIFRLRLEKSGFAQTALATPNPGVILGNYSSSRARRVPKITLIRIEDARDMVRVPEGEFPTGLNGFNTDQLISLDTFLIDKQEVTNVAYQRFVDAGGYREPRYWLDGMPGSAFTDSTGRPGPATWELGVHTSGEDDHPVGGVSWYESAAYCRFAGKALPTVYHWARAALSPVEIFTPLAPAIIPGSNFMGKRAAPVGSFRSNGPYGTVDMAGNMREWGLNESAAGRRWILGGAFSEPSYMFVTPNSLPPGDRSPINGFRCMSSSGDLPQPITGRVELFSRDHRSTKSVSPDVFELFKQQFAYARTPLNPRVESTDTTRPDWIRETLTFDTGYEDGRTAAYLFVPRNAVPPFQLAVFFPGQPVGGGSSADLQPGSSADYIVRSGRALLQPIYKGFYERWEPTLPPPGDEYFRMLRSRIFAWRQDLARALDAVDSRHNVDMSKIAYVGQSFGASAAFPLVALEERFRTAVLVSGGYSFRQMPPEADAINYAPRVTIPVLMLGGRHDYVMPLETSQKPLFERLGAPLDQKRHVIFESGHANFPRSESIREVLGWLDQHLGQVSTVPRTQ